MSLVLAVLLVSQGVVQTLGSSATVNLLQPTTDAGGNMVTQQVLAVGLAASQVAIKQLGTNGGGFFNVNSAHPFENPTPFSNFLEVLSILLIPAALVHTFGKMVGTAPGLGIAGGDDGHLRGDVGPRRVGRAKRQPGLRYAGRRSAGK